MSRMYPKSVSTPSGQRLPNWISAELIAETIEVWQAQYAHRLTEDDAIEILLNVASLFDALGNFSDDTVCGPGESFQP